MYDGYVFSLVSLDICFYYGISAGQGEGAWVKGQGSRVMNIPEWYVWVEVVLAQAVGEIE